MTLAAPPVYPARHGDAVVKVKAIDFVELHNGNAEEAWSDLQTALETFIR